MLEPLNQKAVLLAAIAIFTVVTVWTDVRERKIYNWATVPMWFMGWLYQATWFEWHGLLNGALGCCVGFGLFFTLWAMRIAGGGDVKLVTALGVWLGFLLTTRAIMASLVCILLYQAILTFIGRRQTIDIQHPSASVSDEPTDLRQGSPVQAFAPAIATGTWVVLLTGWNSW